MNYHNVQKIIDEICEKHNIDSELFIGGYTDTISKDGNLSCNFSAKIYYNRNKNKYGILYYKSKNIYIVWDFKAQYKDRNIRRYALKTKYKDVEQSLANNKKYFTRYSLFKGHETEYPLCLISVEELEQFIMTNT